MPGKSKHQMWLELCDLITKHPNEVQGLDVDADPLDRIPLAPMNRSYDPSRPLFRGPGRA